MPGEGSPRSPEGRVRVTRGDRSSPNSELERGCGVCAAARSRTRARAGMFGVRVLRARPAAKLCGVRGGGSEGRRP